MESDTFKELQTICRACLQPSDIPVSLFELKYEQLIISDIFEMCTTIKMEKSTNLPIYICKTCLLDLVRAFNFIKKCQSADQQLKNQNNSILQTKEECNGTVDGFCVNKEANISELCKLELKEESATEMDNLKETNLPFNCDMCGKGCSKTIRLKLPQSDNCPEETSLSIDNNSDENFQHRCGVCGKEFMFLSTLKNHLKQGHKKQNEENDSKLQCQVCFLKVTTKATLRDHMMLHTGEKPIMCDVCGKRFIKKVSLDYHKTLHTGETPYVCEYCGKAFRSTTSYKWHIAIHSSPEDPVPCGICDKVLRSQQAWKKHQLVHNKQFLCNECGKKFVNRTQLREHSNSHFGIRPYLCNICNKTFGQKRELKLHKLRHQVVRPHPCDKCSKTFVTKHKLSVHKKRNHIQE